MGDDIDESTEHKRRKRGRQPGLSTPLHSPVPVKHDSRLDKPSLEILLAPKSSQAKHPFHTTASMASSESGGIFQRPDIGGTTSLCSLCINSWLTGQWSEPDVVWDFTGIFDRQGPVVINYIPDIHAGPVASFAETIPAEYMAIFRKARRLLIIIDGRLLQNSSKAQSTNQSTVATMPGKGQAPNGKSATYREMERMGFAKAASHPANVSLFRMTTFHRTFAPDATVGFMLLAPAELLVGHAMAYFRSYVLRNWTFQDGCMFPVASSPASSHSLTPSLSVNTASSAKSESSTKEGHDFPTSILTTVDGDDLEQTMQTDVSYLPSKRWKSTLPYASSKAIARRMSAALGQATQGTNPGKPPGSALAFTFWVSTPPKTGSDRLFIDRADLCYHLNHPQGPVKRVCLDTSTAAEWVKAPLAHTPGGHAVHLSEQSSSSTTGLTLNLTAALRPALGTTKIPPGAVGYFHNNANNVSQSHELVGLYSAPFKSAHGCAVTRMNFLRVAALFAARKSVKRTWTNYFDEFRPPNTQAHGYKRWNRDCLIYMIFQDKCSVSGLRNIHLQWESGATQVRDYVANHFFFMSRMDMYKLAVTHHFDEMAKDCLQELPDDFMISLWSSEPAIQTNQEDGQETRCLQTSMKSYFDVNDSQPSEVSYLHRVLNESRRKLMTHREYYAVGESMGILRENRVTYLLLEEMDFSPTARRILEAARQLVTLSIATRKSIAVLSPEYHLHAWDAGWYQIKQVLKKYHIAQYNNFIEEFNAFEREIEEGVYNYGFLDRSDQISNKSPNKQPAQSHAMESISPKTSTSSHKETHSLSSYAAKLDNSAEQDHQLSGKNLMTSMTPQSLATMPSTGSTANSARPPQISLSNKPYTDTSGERTLTTYTSLRAEEPVSGFTQGMIPTLAPLERLQEIQSSFHSAPFPSPFSANPSAMVSFPHPFSSRHPSSYVQSLQPWGTMHDLFEAQSHLQTLKHQTAPQMNASMYFQPHQALVAQVGQASDIHALSPPPQNVSSTSQHLTIPMSSQIPNPLQIPMQMSIPMQMQIPMQMAMAMYAQSSVHMPNSLSMMGQHQPNILDGTHPPSFMTPSLGRYESAEDHPIQTHRTIDTGLPETNSASSMHRFEPSSSRRTNVWPKE